MNKPRVWYIQWETKAKIQISAVCTTSQSLCVDEIIVYDYDTGFSYAQ